MTTEPNHGFDDSRRLPGPNRFFADPAATLTPLGAAAADPEALAAWAARVRTLAAALGWPDPLPLYERHGSQTVLAFRAPPDAQLTATDLNEWAWERAAADAGESAFDVAQDLGANPAARLAARAARERLPELVALRAGAARHRLPIFEDDAQVSVGAGAGNRCWPRTALPRIDAVDWEALFDVPTALVTGSNGKTTTVRLLAAMAERAGLTAGLCSTEGVFVGGEAVALGDYSGPDGARSVLRHPRVRAAILETARGGILRRGLAVRRADVAVVTNIRADHYGEYAVATADDLADTKLVVARVLGDGGTLVLNADDATLMAGVARQPHAAAARQALFAFDYRHPLLEALRARGGSTCGVDGGALILHRSGLSTDCGAIAAMPLSLGGVAPHNIANLAAAVLAGAALGFALPVIRETLHRFGADPLDNAGRLECWHYRGATVLIDYAHNPDGLERLLSTARALRPARLMLLLGQAGNRDDEAIAELARTAARFSPDRVLIKDLVLMLRGREAGEVPALLDSALRAAGLDPKRIKLEPDEERAACRLLDEAREGDVVVLPVHTRDVRERLRALLDVRMRK